MRISQLEKRKNLLEALCGELNNTHKETKKKEKEINLLEKRKELLLNLCGDLTGMYVILTSASFVSLSFARVINLSLSLSVCPSECVCVCVWRMLFIL